MATMQIDTSRQLPRMNSTSSSSSERPSISTHISRYGQDWGPTSANKSSIITPFSAVSSFNLPAQYDASLVTPISTTAKSPLFFSKPNLGVFKDFKEREMRLSPTITSPDYLAYSGDDEFRSPLKLKTPTTNGPPTTLKPLSPYPSSPMVCRSPYWGSFGVSAVGQSPRTRTPPPRAESPTTSTLSTTLTSEQRASQQQSSSAPPPLHSMHTSFRPHVQAPILTAPSPAILRAASRSSTDSGYRQDSVVSMASTGSSQTTNPHDYEADYQQRQHQYHHQHHHRPSSSGYGTPPAVGGTSSSSSMSMPLDPLPVRRKRKSPPASSTSTTTTATTTARSGGSVGASSGDGDLPGEISHEDQLLIQLSEKESLQWKEIAQRFNELTGKNMKVPALQMRKKRLRERLRVWSDVEPPRIHNIQA